MVKAMDPKARRRPRRSFGERAFDTALILFMILLMLIMLYPLYLVVIISLSGGMAVMRGGIYWVPADFTLDTYLQVLRKANFLNSYMNTVFYTVAGTAYNVTMTALCAYPLSRRDFYGRGIFATIVVITMFFGGGLIPSFLLVKNLGLLDTRWAIIMPGAISTWNMIVMRTFFQGIPESLTESAYLDGANDIQILFRIILPLSLPIFATMTLFYAVGHWNSYLSAVLYLTDNKLLPVQVLLRNIVINDDMQDMTDVAMRTESVVMPTNFKYATIVITMLPILCIYPFVQKYFTKGVMIGALKG